MAGLAWKHYLTVVLARVHRCACENQQSSGATRALSGPDVVCSHRVFAGSDVSLLHIFSAEARAGGPGVPQRAMVRPAVRPVDSDGEFIAAPLPSSPFSQMEWWSLSVSSGSSQIPCVGAHPFTVAVGGWFGKVAYRLQSLVAFERNSILSTPPPQNFRARPNNSLLPPPTLLEIPSGASYLQGLSIYSLALLPYKPR